MHKLINYTIIDYFSVLLIHIVWGLGIPSFMLFVHCVWGLGIPSLMSSVGFVWDKIQELQRSHVSNHVLICYQVVILFLDFM